MAYTIPPITSFAGETQDPVPHRDPDPKLAQEHRESPAKRLTNGEDTLRNKGTPQMHILMGAPGSGKSTWAKHNPGAYPEPLIDIAALKATLGAPDRPFHWKIALQLTYAAHREVWSESADFTTENTFAYQKTVDKVHKYSGSFNVHGIYFDTGNFMENIRRVKDRQRNGGQSIPAKEIEYLYARAPVNIVENIDVFKTLTFIDASNGQFQVVATWNPKQKLKTLHKTPWLKKFNKLAQVAKRSRKM